MLPSPTCLHGALYGLDSKSGASYMFPLSDAVAIARRLMDQEEGELSFDIKVFRFLHMPNTSTGIMHYYDR